MTSLKHVLSGDAMQAIARSSNINSKRKSTQKRAFDAQAFLDSAGVARRVVEYRRSQRIYAQGDPATSVIYLQKGGVKLSVVNETGKEAVVAILGPGDFLGEGCLARQSICIATATTIGPTSVLVIEKDEMIRTLHEEHEFSDRFIAYMLARNIRVEEDLVDQLFNSTEKRLARTLLLLARYGAQGHPQSVLPKVSQETLAEMIGTTRTRVNFFMNKFKKLGFVQYDGQIRVNNSLLSVVLHDVRNRAHLPAPTVQSSCGVPTFWSVSTENRRRGITEGVWRSRMRRAFPREVYGSRSKIETVISVIKRKLSAKAPGRKCGRHCCWAWPLALSLEASPGFSRGCQQSQLPSFVFNRLEPLFQRHPGGGDLSVQLRHPQSSGLQLQASRSYPTACIVETTSGMSMRITVPSPVWLSRSSRKSTPHNTRSLSP